MSKDFVERCYLAGVETIAIGKLTGIRENIDYTDDLNQRLHSWSFSLLTNMIIYKAAEYGMKVVKVDEAYSSRTCHCDLKVSKSNRKTRGMYSCSCGWNLQADVNAALLRREVATTTVQLIKIEPAFPQADPIRTCITGNGCV